MSSSLQPGLTVPDFELPDEDGVRHRLSDLQGDNYLVLMLARGEHCPRERQQQREMVRFHDWCPVAFTELVTIVPNDPHDTFRMRIAAGAHWTFLADPELEVQQALDINEYTDPHHDNAMVPHTVILSPGLRIEKAYVGYWFWGRPSVWQLWHDLQEIVARTKVDYDPTTPHARAEWAASQTPAAAH